MTVRPMPRLPALLPLYLPILLLLLLLPSLSSRAGALRVEKNAPLSVHKGRVAYVHPHDLILSVPDGDLCKAEVIANDPMSQRVGKLHPPVFSCHFAPYSVRYTHTGSPLLSHDEVRLHVYHFAAHRTITRVVTIRVRVTDVPYNVFVQDFRLKELQVPEFFGLSNTIDASVIRFRYNYYDGATCIVSFSRLTSHFPMQGQIVRGVDQQPVETLRHDCRDFLYLGLRYKHLSPPTPHVDYLPLAVEVSDPAHGEQPVMEYTYLPITIKGAFPNMAPKAALLSSYIMEVEQFVLTTLDPEAISAEDTETPNGQLVFNISRQLLPGFGFFVHMNDHTVPIGSFTQADLMNHNIAYQPPNSTTTSKELIEVQFVVFDSYFASSQPITLHIAIRPTNTHAPCVTLNTGLRLIEGQSRPITTENLMVVDSDNIDDVRLYVKGGLRHGRLEVNGRSAVMFSVNDLETGRVVYRHDDSDSPEDKIVFRISDGSNTVRTKFPITVLSKDDSAPYLINNVGLELMEGGQVQITDSLLSAHDKDSEDTSITYVIKAFPQGGEIMKKYRPMTRGRAMSKFTQQELSRGLIYYHHLGGEIFKDSFEFRLQDDHEPPNRSGKYSVSITVRSVDDMPPQLVPGTTRHLSVYETDVAVITPDSLQYFDSESTDSDLLYTITNQPFFLTTTITINAGRVVSTSNATSITKDANMPAMTSFTQSEVNHGKVAYMPAADDIGPIRRHARFHFTVSDSSGNKVMDQPFDITILPVNNQLPHLSVRPLSVVEGGAARISTNDISAYDPDTDQDELRFVLDIRPRFGKLVKDEVDMAVGESFTLSDLMKPSIRYVHKGSDDARDSFTLSVSDGINRVTKPVHVDVKLVNDHVPTLLRNLRTEIQVKEGGDTAITSANLAATDNDTDDNILSFVVLRSPQYGQIQVHGKRVSQFTQADVWNKVVKYVHTSGEIGPDPLRDSATFAVTDQGNTPGIKETPLLDLNITVMPVDNQEPYILLGSPLFVTEGQRAAITFEILNAQDVDTPLDVLTLVVTKPPDWGFIENITPDIGSEVSNIGKPVSEINVSHLKSSNVRYVQANHTGVEPISDTFEVLLTDGARHSAVATIPVSIVPRNDELPVLKLNDLVVGEGGDVVVSPGELVVSDADVPADRLVLSVARPPRHGKLVLLTHAPNQGGLIQLPMQDITLDEMQRDMSLVYIHDSSENYNDNFMLHVTDGEHVTRQTANVKIVPLNDEKPHVVKNAGLRVSYGGSGLLSSVVLRTVDTDNDDNEVCFHIIDAPEKGALQFLRNPTGSTEQTDSIEWIELKSGRNFSQEDADMNRVRYVHMAAMDDAGKDSFRFLVTDGVYKTAPETFEIEILSPRMREIAVLNRDLQVKEGDSKVLTTDVLSASDGTRRPQDMWFRITKPPTQGHIALITEKTTIVSTFSQLDLAAQKIVYIHSSKADVTEDFFLFVVTNGANQSRSGVFRIAIEPLDQELPSLDTNMPLTVVQSETVPLTSTNLRVTDPDTPSENLTYILSEGPSHGELLVRGLPVTSTFTQLDLDTGVVEYRSKGTDDAGMDFFLFMVSDMHHEGYLRNGSLQTKAAFFSLLIQPLAKEPPRLINSKRPQNLEQLGPGKFGFMISRHNLLVTHPLSDNSGIIYTMLVKPTSGYMENPLTKKPIKKRFSQQDIDEGRVTYVLDAETPGTNDSFVYRVQDTHRNTLDDQRFVLEWSVIEMVQAQYIVCEDAGTLTISLTRQGAIEGSAYVDIRTKEMSAKDGLDYIPSRTAQLQFDPGVTSVSWDVEIVADNLEENNEKFRVLLKSPVNAVMGSHDKATVQIVNLHNGRCAEYIGMISKSQVPVKFPAVEEVQDRAAYHLLTDVQTEEDRDRSEGGRHDDGDQLSTTAPPGDIDVFSFGDLDLENDMSDNQPDAKRKTDRTSNWDKDRRGRRRGRKGRKRGRKGKRNNSSVSTSPVVTTAKPTDPVAPQSCTKETKGLLYFDLKTARMFRCNGLSWERWDTHQLHNRMFKTAPDKAVPDTEDDPEPPTRRKDQCEQGWEPHRDDCYKVLGERLTWNEGEKVCEEQQQGHLAHVESAKHLEWLWKMADHEPFWIGMNDKRMHHRWEYTDGGPVRFYHWRRGFPRSQQSLAKHCVLVAARAEWVNRLCDKNTAKSVCVRPLHATQNTNKWRRKRRRRRRWHGF